MSTSLWNKTINNLIIVSSHNFRKIQIAKLADSHLVYLIEDLTDMILSSEIKPPLA